MEDSHSPKENDSEENNVDSSYSKTTPRLIEIRNLSVLLSLLPSAVRGFILKRGKDPVGAKVRASYDTHFNWQYGNDHPKLAKLYAAAKVSQWNSDEVLDWKRPVDPYHNDYELFIDSALPFQDLKSYRGLSSREQKGQRASFMSWMLSQFLHGEQGALYAASQTLEAIQWYDGKLYGSTQVVDEGRHVEVFHRYLVEKLEKKYSINNSLYVIIDALISDSRWDIKFLGMQIMIEGLALGAFQTLRNSTQEPLLKELLKYVILDEGRHVHYGVASLGDFYLKELTEKQRTEREEWAFEVAIMMRNRFLAHEFYEEYYAHQMSRKSWDKFILESKYMLAFRDQMFRRLVPNLKKIHLLSKKMRPHYEKAGLLRYEHEKSADDLSESELINDSNSNSLKSEAGDRD